MGKPQVKGPSKRMDSQRSITARFFPDHRPYTDWVIAVFGALRLHHAFQAIHVGDLKPGIELELISALDLQTITWSHVPVTWIFMAGDLVGQEKTTTYTEGRAQ